MPISLLVPELLTHGEIARRIGTSVRARREAQGLSRKALAEKSGVSVPTISRLELSGICTLDVLIKLAQALNCTANLLEAFPAPHFESLDAYLKARGVAP